MTTNNISKRVKPTAISSLKGDVVSLLQENANLRIEFSKNQLGFDYVVYDSYLNSDKYTNIQNIAFGNLQSSNTFVSPVKNIDINQSVISGDTFSYDIGSEKTVDISNLFITGVTKNRSNSYSNVSSNGDSSSISIEGTEFPVDTSVTITGKTKNSTRYNSQTLSNNESTTYTMDSGETVEEIDASIVGNTLKNPVNSQNSNLSDGDTISSDVNGTENTDVTVSLNGQETGNYQMFAYGDSSGSYDFQGYGVSVGKNLIGAVSHYSDSVNSGIQMEIMDAGTGNNVFSDMVTDRGCEIAIGDGVIFTYWRYQHGNNWVIIYDENGTRLYEDNNPSSNISGYQEYQNGAAAGNYAIFTGRDDNGGEVVFYNQNGYMNTEYDISSGDRVSDPHVCKDTKTAYVYIEGDIYSYDLTTGNKNWSANVPNSGSTSQAIDVSPNGVLVKTNTNGYAYKFDVNGNLEHSVTNKYYDEVGLIQGVMVLSDQNQNIYGYDEVSGNQIWSYSLDAYQIEAYGGYVYISYSDNNSNYQIRILDSNGNYKDEYNGFDDSSFHMGYNRLYAYHNTSNYPEDLAGYKGYSVTSNPTVDIYGENVSYNGYLSGSSSSTISNISPGSYSGTISVAGENVDLDLSYDEKFKTTNPEITISTNSGNDTISLNQVLNDGEVVDISNDIDKTILVDTVSIDSSVNTSYVNGQFDLNISDSHITNDPSVSVGPSDTISHTGLLREGKSKTKTVSLSEGQSNIVTSLTGNDVNVDISWEETTKSVNPSIDINTDAGNQSVEYTGTLNNGETVDISNSIDNSKINGNVSIVANISSGYSGQKGSIILDYEGIPTEGVVKYLSNDIGYVPNELVISDTVDGDSSNVYYVVSDNDGNSVTVNNVDKDTNLDISIFTSQIISIEVVIESLNDKLVEFGAYFGK